MEVGHAGQAAPDAPPQTTRDERIILAALVCVGLGVRIYAGTVQRMPEFDATFYVNYFRVPGWQWVFPPGYPAAIELARLVIGDGVAAARIVSACWGAVLAIPVFLVARYYVSSPLAFAAALLVELNPLMIRQSAMAQSEMQYITLVLFAFWLYLRGRRVSAGATAGLAYLTRPDALVVFGALWLYDAYRTRRASELARFLIGFLLLSLPYVGYLRVTTGEWTVSPKTMNIRERGETLQQAMEMESMEYRAPTFLERMNDGVVHYPDRFARYGGFLIEYAGIAACLLALVGLAGKSGPLLCGMSMLAVLPVFGLKVEERFVVPYIPFVIVLSVIAIGMARKTWLVVSGLLLSVISVVPTMAFIVAPEDRGGIEFVEAGVAMRQLAAPGDIFIDRKPFVAFYAGGSFRGLPNDSLPAVLEYAREVKAKYLVLSERVVRLFRPQLRDVIRNDTLLTRMGLMTVYQKGLGTGYGVRIVSLGP